MEICERHLDRALVRSHQVEDRFLRERQPLQKQDCVLIFAGSRTDVVRVVEHRVPASA